jgi:hypothetical protein
MSDYSDYENEYEHLLLYEKIRKRNRKNKKRKPANFIVGAIHYVEDRLVHFDGKRKEFHEGMRPGVVCGFRGEENKLEIRWVPGSHLIKNREENEVVFLESRVEKFRYDTVLLLKYPQWFKPVTLGERYGKLSYEKNIELQQKCEAIWNGQKFS